MALFSLSKKLLLHIILNKIIMSVNHVIGFRQFMWVMLHTQLRQCCISHLLSSQNESPIITLTLSHVDSCGIPLSWTTFIIWRLPPSLAPDGCIRESRPPAAPLHSTTKPRSRRCGWEHAGDSGTKTKKIIFLSNVTNGNTKLATSHVTYSVCLDKKIHPSGRSRLPYSNFWHPYCLFVQCDAERLQLLRFLFVICTP